MEYLIIKIPKNFNWGLFSGMNFSSSNQNNNLLGNQTTFGQHLGFGKGNINNNKSSADAIALQIHSPNGNSGNNISHFAGIGNFGNSLFCNATQNNNKDEISSNKQIFFYTHYFKNERIKYN